MSQLQRVRLLNPSIYAATKSDVFRAGDVEDQSIYPVIVDAEVKDFRNFSFADVSPSELDRVFPIMFSDGSQYKRSGSLHFWNNPASKGDHIQRTSYEVATPFDYWNKLKSSRPVGDVVPAGYL